MRLGKTFLSLWCIEVLCMGTRTLAGAPLRAQDSVASTPTLLEQDHTCVMPSVSKGGGALRQASRGVLSRAARNNRTKSLSVPPFCVSSS
uniref:Putative secreted protein n=1 Tax=Ixodes ricinus TaxID=34613 RepID=A0A6B0UAH5_IXORI